MSPQHALHPAYAPLFANSPRLPALARVALAVAVTVTKWDARYRTRKQLARLSPEQLDDIGMTRGQAYTEAARPFWRD
ncbi:MAG: DUF1127 domain-containing protein [Paracoccaceae bacterium]